MKKTFTAPEMSISKFDCENIATTGSNIGTTAVDNVSVKLGVRIFFCKLSFCGKIYIFQGRAFVLPSYNIS